jgi:hypothetical protein
MPKRKQSEKRYGAKKDNKQSSDMEQIIIQVKG